MNTNEPYITKVYLLDVPLENKYKDTLVFSSQQDQRDYFESKIIESFGYENFSYQRKDNTIRFPVHIDTLRGLVNYVMYQNTYYSNKWFYAFITDMKYINDGCTEITIETDVLQTWMFDYTVHQSFIEREHTSDDTFGKNTIPENLETGEYMVANRDTPINVFDYTNCHPVVVVTEYIGIVYPSSSYHVPTWEIPNGLTYMMAKTIGDMYEIINKYDHDGKGESIVSIFVAPEQAFEINLYGWSQYTWTNDIGQTITIDFSVSGRQYYSSEYTYTKYNYLGNSYTPRNNKLLCYPFRYLQIDNNSGSCVNYHYEDFHSPNESTIKFILDMATTPSMSAKISPYGYKKTGGGNVNELNYEEGLTLGKLPIGVWVSDVYTNWLTQNALNLSVAEDYAKFKSDFGMVNSGLNGIGSILSGLTSVLGGDSSGIGTAISGFTSNAMSGYYSYANGYYDIQKINAMRYEHSLVPPISKGNLNCGDVNYSSTHSSPTFKAIVIKEEYARIIDDYFDMYGYQTNRVKTPNSWHRQEWWYTKTINANITGAIPNDDIAKIINIYDNGITFWKDPNHIYNYGLPNPIV